MRHQFTLYYCTIKHLDMNIKRTITLVIYVSLLSAQFKPGFVKVPKEEMGIEAEGLHNEDQVEKFKHKQVFSMSVSYTHLTLPTICSV